ncbi:OmpA family protein [Aquimarina longa]|uniref:OmpA family protein n=1 Tax=Aquimarina longa TaxID=1080221 RepID=UPI000783634D|nr:OmpA family protein [Aquimarina longa]
MKKLTSIILFLFLISSSISIAQDGALKKANAYFENFAYIDAINAYEKITRNGNGTLEVYQNLADSYFFNSDFESAAKWYQEMINTNEEISFEHYFRAAQSFKYLKNYDLANSFMKKLLSTSTNDSRINRLMTNPDYLEDIKNQSGRYAIVNLEENSLFTDFAPSFYKNQLVFSSAREKGKVFDQKNKWTKQPYLELFNSYIKDNGSLSVPLKFSKKINTRLHESTSTFTKDHKTVYFTRNNFLNLKLKKDSIDVNRLKIFKATLNDKLKWDTIEELPFNNDHYSVAHPALSPDGKKLYFASDMPGGCGMSDLYVVSIQEDGSFGEPQNLGTEINTEGRDTFPFVSETGMLYFASDGHLGLGGLDIFVVKLEDEQKEVYNVGEPINSSADDVTFIIDDTTHKGYFSSNRPGGKGDDDIYSLVEITPLITKCDGSIKGTAIDEDSGSLLTNATIEIKDEEGKVLYTGKTDDNGAFFKKVDCNDKTYVITVTKEDFDPMVKKIIVTRKDPNPSKTLKLKNNAPEKGVDLAKLLNLQPIYFASNKALILGKTAKELDKVITYMKEYPTIRIEIGSHTDSRGSDSYNMKLSTKRAITTANYIISKGIDNSRVKSRGYGETVLKNRCGNRVKCSKEEHAKNRRSEFIVIDN